MLETSYHYLITCGVHVGHSLLNSHRFCGWMVLAQRQKILLIDLSKFLYMFSKGIRMLQTAVRFRHPIWFISLDPMKGSVVRIASKFCGEYHVSTHWIGGLLTNYLSISRNSWWRYLYLSPMIHSAKQRLRQEIYEDWVLTRLTWPRVVFLCGVRKSYRVAKEALRALIPCIGIADTATSAHALSLAVPGNDESLEAIYFYNSLVAQTILLKKFSQVFSWANGVRKTGRLGSFAGWFAFRNSWRLAKTKSLSPKRPSFSPLWRRSSHWASSHSDFCTTASLMHRLTQYRLAAPRSLPQPRGDFWMESEEDQEATPSSLLSFFQVRNFFLVNQSLFNGLLALRFLALQRRCLRREIQPHFTAFRRKRPINYSGRKETFTFRHNYLDLTAPSYLTLDRDYLYKRAIGKIEEAFMLHRNPFFQQIFFNLLSTLFLLYSYYQRGPLQTPGAPLNFRNYRGNSPFRRRLRRERSQTPRFFKDVLYGFLLRCLHLNRRVSRSYRLPFFSISRNLPKKLPLLSSLAPGKIKPSPIVISQSRSRFKMINRVRPSLWHLWYRLWSSPRRLRRLAISRAQQQRFLFPKISQLSPLAFSFFALNKWSFYDGFLPKSYWQFRLLYLPTRDALSKGKSSERHGVQRRLQSYPLLHHSLFWIRRKPSRVRMRRSRRRVLRS